GDWAHSDDVNAMVTISPTTKTPNIRPIRFMTSSGSENRPRLWGARWSSLAVLAGKGLGAPCRSQPARAWTLADRRDNNATIHSPSFPGGTHHERRPHQAPEPSAQSHATRLRPETSSMRIDAYTHFFPKKFFDKMMEIAGDYKDMGKRVRSLPALYDLDFRKKIVDGHKDYQQILSYPQPPFESLCKTPQQMDEMIRLCNDGFAELCDKEKDHFPGWVAQVALGAPDAGAAEAERAIKNGALGVQIYTNVGGKPIDLPQYRPSWAKMNKLGKPIWLHPARSAETPDYPLAEKKSLYEIWWTLGWSYETACAMTRLVYSKIMDDYPNLKIITHHFGGIVPMLEGRVGPGNEVMGWDRAPRTRIMSGCARALRSGRSTISSRTSGPTPPCSAARRRPSAGLSSFRSKRSCSRPTARSIPRAAPCIRA